MTPHPLDVLIEAIAKGKAADVFKRLAADPALARATVSQGPSRTDAQTHFLKAIAHQVYEGDTALHIAAAARQTVIAEGLIALGADPRARNRRGAEPLHYAADGGPGAPGWDPQAQATMIAVLLAAGADPDARDAGGVTPLLRATRNRCANAVTALLAGGADPRVTNKNGSSALRLARQPTGRGGVGSPEAKAEQAEILRALEQALR